MKKVQFLTAILLTNLFFIACMSPSDDELREAEKLNKLFPEYVFTPTGDMYLEVKILKEVVDTAEIKKIYDTACLRKKESENFQVFRSDVPWIYLNFYNAKGSFYFSLSKAADKYEFSRQEYH